jgi:hypothetical protein
MAELGRKARTRSHTSVPPVSEDVREVAAAVLPMPPQESGPDGPKKESLSEQARNDIAKSDRNAAARGTLGRRQDAMSQKSSDAPNRPRE